MRSRGVSAAEFNVCEARVFLDMPQEALIHNIIKFLGRT